MVDNGWIHYGVSAEIIALATENLFEQMICPPIRIGMNDSQVLVQEHWQMITILDPLI